MLRWLSRFRYHLLAIRPQLDAHLWELWVVFKKWGCRSMPVFGATVAPPFFHFVFLYCSSQVTFIQKPRDGQGDVLPLSLLSCHTLAALLWTLTLLKRDGAVISYAFLCENGRFRPRGRPYQTQLEMVFEAIIFDAIQFQLSFGQLSSLWFIEVPEHSGIGHTGHCQGH